MKTKILFFSLSCCLLLLAFHGPDRTLTGTVTSSDGEPLIGAKVWVDQTAKSTYTDYEGHFSMQIPEGKVTLEISYVGLQKQIVPIEADQTEVSIQFNPVPLPVPERMVKGQVLDTNGEPLISASVLIQGTGRGTVTDFEGNFSLLVPGQGDVSLVFSYIGYESQTYALKPDEHEIKLKLEPGNSALDEVVVTSMSIARSEATESYSLTSSPSAPPPPPAAPKSLMLTEAVTKKTADLAEVYEAPMEDAEFVDFSADDGMSKEEAFMRGLPYPGGGGAAPAIKAGQLTAGEVNDFMKWDLWKDISEEDLLTHQQSWQILPKDRYMVQLQTEKGHPLPDALVQLLSTEGQIIWETRTDNTGKAELWSNLFYGQQDVAGKLLIQYDGQTKEIQSPKSFQQGLNIQQMNMECDMPQAVDIVFAVDATGSMQDEINYLKAELNDVIARIKDTLPDIELRLGSVFYRDKTDAYLTRQTPLSSDISKTTDFIKAQNAGGGGDRPEAVEDALRVAIQDMDWSANAVARIVFLVLDAPPHNNPEVQAYLRQLTQKAAQKGVRIVPVACSGTDKPMEYLMRSISLATNGSYIFLTDDSGIGLSHIEPTTDDYKVEKLNDLLQRVIYQFAFTPDCDQPLYATIEAPADTALVAKTLQPKEGEETPASIRWKYYPNPTAGQITIEIEGPIEFIFLTDLSGKVLERIAVNGIDRLELDISRYPDGIYNLRYEYQQDRWMNGKIVLARA